MPDDRTARIRALNDQFRHTLCGGTVVVTRGLRSHGQGFVDDVIAAVAKFNEFSDGNDPYGEHDFGLVVVDGVGAFWKIDYYDEGLSSAASDPADSDSCCRVLTVMLAEEY